MKILSKCNVGRIFILLDLSTKYFANITDINCGGSGHVSKVCPKLGAVTKKLNQTSNEFVIKNPGMSKKFYLKNHPQHFHELFSFGFG